MARHYRELVVWQKGIEFATLVYAASRKFPRDEVYGLTIQMRRAAVSVPSNIAEGQGRRSPADFERFLRIAQGSLNELETQIYIAERLEYLTAESTQRLLRQSSEIGRLLGGLIRALRRSPVA